MIILLDNAQIGKWFVGAGFLVAAVLIIFAGLALGSQNTVLYVFIPVGILLGYAVIDDQILRNIRINKKTK